MEKESKPTNLNPLGDKCVNGSTLREHYEGQIFCELLNRGLQFNNINQIEENFSTYAKLALSGADALITAQRNRNNGKAQETKS